TPGHSHGDTQRHCRCLAKMKKSILENHNQGKEERFISPLILQYPQSEKAVADTGNTVKSRLLVAQFLYDVLVEQVFHTQTEREIGTVGIAAGKIDTHILFRFHVPVPAQPR